MQDDTFERWARGAGCPFDPPRPAVNDEWDFVAAMSVSSLYLTKNQTYRGQSILVLDSHAARPDQLSAEQWGAFCADLQRAERAIVRAVAPDHVNFASLGNIVPHLHWHIVPRYRGDPRWGAPTWTTTPAEMLDTRLDDGERTELLDAIRAALDPP